MAQEYIDTRKILEELAALKRKINEIEIVVAKKNVEKPLAKKFFGRLKGKFKKTAQELKDDARKGWD
jgi:hypothetical protein